MQSFLSDMRFAIRRLGKSPGFSFTTILMLGLGIGLSVTMYSVVSKVLLAGLPYPDGGNVVVVSAANARQGVSDNALTPAEAAALAQPDGPFAEFGYFSWGGLTVYQGERPREFTLAIVGEGFFPSLGLAPALGRVFAKEDFESGADAIVLSHQEWQRLLGGAPDAIGRMIETSDGPMRVIGVMPPQFTVPSDDIGAWRPWASARMQSTEPWFWNARFAYAVARLDPGRSAEEVEQRLEALHAGLRERYSMSDEGWRLVPKPLLDTIVGDFRGVLWGAFAIALLVLLIGCANVSIAIDARQVARRHEQALAQALGANRLRLYRTLLLEIGVLALLAAAVGVAISVVGVEWLRELARNSLPRVDAIRLDLDALVFAVATGVLLPGLAVVAGSLRVRGAASDAMRSGGRGLVSGSSRGRRLLPVLGVALSTVSLVAACALLLSLSKLRQVDPGFRADNVYALQLFVDGDPDVWRQSSALLLPKLAALPGVEQVAVTSAAPLSQIGSFSIDAQVPGREQPEPYQIGLRRVSPEYLDTLGIPLLEGRNLQAGDGEGSEAVTVVSRELARRMFGDESAIDRVIGLPLGKTERVPFRIVGVMQDIRNDGLRQPSAPELLISHQRSPWMGMTFLVRSSGELPGMQALIADALWQVLPREAITREFTLQQEIDSQLATARFFSRTVGAFSIAALLLAALGVYAVAALQQQRRMAEFGLRLAVGARPSSLVVQILRDCLATAFAGIVLGLIGAWTVLGLIESQLFSSGGAHLDALLLGALSIGLAALFAGLLPALRAARVDPMDSLRHE